MVQINALNIMLEDNAIMHLDAFTVSGFTATSETCIETLHTSG